MRRTEAYRADIDSCVDGREEVALLGVRRCHVEEFVCPARLRGRDRLFGHGAPVSSEQTGGKTMQAGSAIQRRGKIIIALPLHTSLYHFLRIATGSVTA